MNRPFTIALLILFLLGIHPQPAAAQVKTAPPVDPIWCPAGVPPVGGTGGCSPSFGRLSDLLAWLLANDPNTAGVIWLEKTYDSDFELVDGFTLDGRRFARMDNHPLTIQGGWDGPGTSTVDHSDPSEFWADYLSVYLWNSDVTVNDVLVQWPAAAGLTVFTTGAIALDHVTVNNSVGPTGGNSGADLMNFTGTGNVSVSESTFHGNAGTGLGINSAGAITLHNVTANNNGSNYSGAHLDNRPSALAQPVVLTGHNTFNNNGSGLNVWSDGSIAIHNLTASDNNGPTVGSGAYLDNTSAGKPQRVTLTGDTHSFYNNTLTGLTVNSKGPISVENVYTAWHGQWGAVLNNAGPGGLGPVRVTGSNSFNGNGNSGLNVFSNNTIFLSGITADGNAADGFLLSTPSTAKLSCGKVYSNGDYGVDAAGVIGMFTLDDIFFNGANVSGDYAYGGVPVITTGGC